MIIIHTPRSKHPWGRWVLLSPDSIVLPPHSSHFLGLSDQAIFSIVLSKCLLSPSMSGREGSSQWVRKGNKMEERKRKAKERGVREVREEKQSL